MIYKITADIRYLDGALVGLTIQGGYCVTTPGRDLADQTQEWLIRMCQNQEPVSAAVTGNRYVIAGNIHREKLV